MFYDKYSSKKIASSQHVRKANESESEEYEEDYEDSNESDSDDSEDYLFCEDDY